MKVIIRREPVRNGGKLILFFPDTFERGKIEYYTFFDGIHGECNHDYYLLCEPVKELTTEEKLKIFRYQTWLYHMTAKPFEPMEPMIIVKRLSRKHQTSV